MFTVNGIILATTAALKWCVLLGPSDEITSCLPGTRCQDGMVSAHRFTPWAGSELLALPLVLHSAQVPGLGQKAPVCTMSAFFSCGFSSVVRKFCISCAGLAWCRTEYRIVIYATDPIFRGDVEFGSGRVVCSG